MQDQVAKLNDQGISACMIQGHSVHATALYCGDGSVIKLPLDLLENPTYKLFYMHPEMCVYDKKIQVFFKCIP
jgi:superfamily II DNA helicase RecQ